jgi:hypothetical protein
LSRPPCGIAGSGVEPTEAVLPLGSRVAALGDGSTRLPSADLSALRVQARAITAGEWLLALALVLGLWLPDLAGRRAWLLPVVVLVLIAIPSWIRAGRVPRASLVVAAYIVVVTAAGLHGQTLDFTGVAGALLKPLIALAVAVLVTTSRQRARVMALLVVVAAVEVPITGVQAAKNAARLGSNAVAAADGVTGTLGTSQASVVALLGLLAASLLVGAWLAGLPGRLALPLVVLLVAVGVFSSTRAVVGLVPFMALALAAAFVPVKPSRAVRRRLVGVVAAGLLAAPLLYGGIEALYPGAFVGVFSSQATTVLGGATAQGIPVVTPAPEPTPAASSAPAPALPSGPAAVVPSGVQLLPGRLGQLRLAARLSTDRGLSTFLVGRGLGSSALGPTIHLAQLVPPPQRTSSTWLGRALTETGWVGVFAFGALLIWLVGAGHRLWTRGGSAADRALGAALPTIAALTAAGAVLTTILDVRGFALPFWILVGLTVSALREAGPRSASLGHAEGGFT